MRGRGFQAKETYICNQQENLDLDLHMILQDPRVWYRQTATRLGISIKRADSIGTKELGIFKGLRMVGSHLLPLELLKRIAEATKRPGMFTRVAHFHHNT